MFNAIYLSIHLSIIIHLVLRILSLQVVGFIISNLKIYYYNDRLIRLSEKMPVYVVCLHLVVFEKYHLKIFNYIHKPDLSLILTTSVYQ